MRASARSAVLALALATSACEPGAKPTPSAPPPLPAAVAKSASGVPSRIVLIVIDALRADHLPPYGSPKPAPFIARLASEGVVFERALAASTWTGPSMASIFTSLYPSQHGVRTGYATTKRALLQGQKQRLNRIPKSLETLPMAMKALGYKTYAAVDNLNICDKMGFAAGFDQFAPFRYQTADALNAKLREWAGDIVAQKRAFLYVHYMDMHRPYKAREPWFDKSARDPKLAAYDSNIPYLDGKIEELFTLLKLDDDALLVVTADHGEEFLDHGGTGHGFQLYQELARVPLIVHAPARYAARRVADAVSTIDLLPSFVELAGGAPRPHWQGTSLAPLLAGRTLPARAFFPMRSSELEREPATLRGVVSGRWKYIVTLPPGKEELYDIDADPREKANLEAGQAAALKELRARLAAFDAGAKIWPREFEELAPMTPEQQEQLRALGYLR